jgi:hypothetical protein
MNSNLYFIPILSRALVQPDAKVTLANAFEQIQRLGTERRYQNGLSQFRSFMQTAAEHRRSISGPPPHAEVTRQLMLQLPSDGFEGSDAERQAALDLIHSEDGWSQELAQLTAEFGEAAFVQNDIHVVLYREDEALARVPVGKEAHRQTVEQIRPGQYVLALQTGRVLWEQLLSEKDLIWSVAYPARPLPLAADTGRPLQRPTRQARLLCGRLVLRVSAGTQAGRLEIQTKP